MGVSQFPVTLIERAAEANFAGVSSISPESPNPQKKSINPKRAIYKRTFKSYFIEVFIRNLFILKFITHIKDTNKASNNNHKYPARMSFY